VFKFGEKMNQRGTSPVRLKRNDWTVEVSPATWAAILDFLNEFGWRSDVLTRDPPTGDLQVSASEAERLVQAGDIVFEETMKEPLAAYSIIRFNMGKFSEIIEFAREGQFVMHR
jgi:hypothetical protein